MPVGLLMTAIALSFFIWLTGGVLCLASRNDSPKDSSTFGITSFISIIVFVLLLYWCCSAHKQRGYANKNYTVKVMNDEAMASTDKDGAASFIINGQNLNKQFGKQFDDGEEIVIREYEKYVAGVVFEERKELVGIDE